MRAVFPTEALTPVAGVIRARRRATRVMTPARLAGLAAAREKLRGVYPRATSRLQDRAETGTLDLGDLRGAGGRRHDRHHVGAKTDGAADAAAWFQ
jgi:hypothetical protein